MINRKSIVNSPDDRLRQFNRMPIPNSNQYLIRLLMSVLARIPFYGLDQCIANLKHHRITSYTVPLPLFPKVPKKQLIHASSHLLSKEIRRGYGFSRRDDKLLPNSATKQQS